MQEAKEQLQQVLVDNPSSGHAWYTLGEMAEETGDRAEAARCYEQGIKALGMRLLSHCCQLSRCLALQNLGRIKKSGKTTNCYELGVKASDILLPHISWFQLRPLSMSGFAMFA